MPGSCLALVSPQTDLVQAVYTTLDQRLHLRGIVCDFTGIQNYLSRDRDGLVLVLLSTMSDREALKRLLQLITLQEYPPVIGVVVNGEVPITALAEFRTLLTGCFSWPDDTDRLINFVREFGECRRPFVDSTQLPLDELLRYQLQEQTPSLLPFVERLALAAEHEVTVLLTGETGTGKTYCARLIHHHSPRSQHRFLTVACGAISANLLQSEFFGHAKGAFTGADREKIGKFAAVGEGTLLLDEIDTLSVEQQAALLRVIESGEFEPVGSVDTQICRGRVIVASNSALEKAVEAGTFRADLFFRLNVMSFHLPPLRERIQDIAPLAQGMAVRFAHKFNKDLFEIGPETLNVLEAFPWPGNIRQLENVIQHGVLLSKGAELLPEHLPEVIREHIGKNNGSPSPKNGHTLFAQRDETEKQAIEHALMVNGYNRSRAADMLGISRVTLYKKMEKYQLTEIPLPTSRRMM